MGSSKIAFAKLKVGIELLQRYHIIAPASCLIRGNVVSMHMKKVGGHESLVVSHIIRSPDWPNSPFIEAA